MIPYQLEAGKLSNFESKSTTKKDDGEKRSIMSSLISSVLEGKVETSASSVKDDSDNIEQDNNSDIKIEATGFTPYIRLDYNHQRLNGPIEANDYLVQLGYDNVALGYRETQYYEAGIEEDLKLSYLHVLIRSGISDDLGGIKMGLGMVTLRGNERNHGVSLFGSYIYHPRRIFGFEMGYHYSSIQENSLHDIDSALLIGHKRAQARLGYRIVHSVGESLTGPYLGLSLKF